MKVLRNFLYVRDLQSTPQTLKEGLEIFYAIPNLFVLSLSLECLVGAKNWLEIFTTTVFSSKDVPVYFLSLSEINTTQCLAD